MPVTLSPLRGWGRGPVRLARVLRPGPEDGLAQVVAPGGAGGSVTVRGAGVSYGDAALPPADGGCVLDMSARSRVVSLDVGAGLVVVQSGMTLRRLQSLVAPYGWAVPVLPGTGAVTVGGAVASDVHGKNQPGAGTFGDHVAWLTLVHPEGTGRRLGPDRDPGGFWATVGGLGLTGVIDLVALQLTAVRASAMVQHRFRTGSLADSLRLMQTLAQRQEADGQLHVVAWVDATSRAATGRGLIDVCAPCEPEGAGRAQGSRGGRRPRHVPSLPGPGLISRPILRTMDAAHWRLTPTGAGRVLTRDRALLPMDTIDWWPAAFGDQGLVQYQLLLPDEAVDQLDAALRVLRRFDVPPALAVIKRFTGTPSAPLGFAARGWSLACDFPRRWASLEPALRSLDDLVARAGGRVYLTKDSRLPAEQVTRMYPRLPEWRRERDLLDPSGRMTSALGVRAGLVTSA
jgi:decaprenylphospho-beta-D-ribofuranose 2-oxidase